MRFIFKIMMAFLPAYFLGCKEDSEVDPSEVIQLQWKNTGPFYADGESKVMLIVRTAKNAAQEYKAVKITTGTGHFINNDTTIILNFNLKEIDSTELTLGTTPGSHSISAEIGTSTIFKDQKTITLLPVPIEQVFRSISFDALDSIEADGEHEVIVSVEMGVKTDVKFATECGTFHELGGEAAQSIVIQLDNLKQGSAIYRVGQEPGPCTFSIQAIKPSYDSLITFDVSPAYADQAVIEIPAVQIDRLGDQLEVTAVLSRNEGKVSKDVTVVFDAFRENNGSPIGYFTDPSVKTGTEESAKTTFVLPNVDVPVGESIVLRATTPQSANAPALVVTRSITIK